MVGIEVTALLSGSGGALAGGAAGWCAGRIGSRVLSRLRRGVPPPPLWCEAGVAVLWALVVARAVTGALPLWWTAVPLALGWYGVLLAACDLLASRLPDVLTLSAYPVVYAVIALVAYGSPIRPEARWGVLAAALIGSVLFAGGYACVRLITAEALGPGDVKLAGSLGAAVGTVSVAAVLLTMFGAAVVTLAAAAATRRAAVPHGPAMLLPAWLVTAFPASVTSAPALPFPQFAGG